jgi:hypothetical protein
MLLLLLLLVAGDGGYVQLGDDREEAPHRAHVACRLQAPEQGVGWR